MRYLDLSRLEAIDPADFARARPYPWKGIADQITATGYRELLANMPPLELFERKFGYRRRAGQAPHDRYSLEYTPDTPVPQPWQDFIAELRSEDYRRQIMRIFGCRRPVFRFHWHYTPTGCSVSPHCDARREYGSQLFYFNDVDDWRPEWGGATLILDDGGWLSYDSAPALEEFVGVEEAPSIGNQSSLIQRSDHAWHAVRPISCPEDRLRRVFIVVINPDTLYWRIRDRLVGKQAQRL